MNRKERTTYEQAKARFMVRFPKLRPSSTAISVRLPETLLTELELLSNKLLTGSPGG